jgi:hypothetical protein
MTELPDPRDSIGVPIPFEDLLPLWHGKKDPDYPERCGWEGPRPDDDWGGSRAWRWSEHRLAKIWFVPVDVPGHVGNWGDWEKRRDEIVAGLSELGFEVEMYPDGSSDELIEMLQGPADYRLIAAHGEEDEDGIRATDRIVSWSTITENIGATGLLHMLSCWSFGAGCVDDGGYYKFRDGLLHAGCSAAILCHGSGHHFPGQLPSGESFEIQRILWLIGRSLKVGLRAAITEHRNGYQSMLGKLGASILVDHEGAVGDPKWGIKKVSHSESESPQS